jgi:type I restriction enzyme S subunit
MMERLSISELARKGWLYFSDGYRTKKPELGPHGYPIMRVAQVLDGYVGPASDPEYVRDEFRKKIGLKSSVNGDVILTTKGTVGRMAKITAEDEGYVYSPQVCFFRILDDSRIDKDYLFYTMAADDFRRQMLSVSTQTDMAPYINLKDLGSLEIDLPHLTEQQSIASVLSALDGKIELNRRMNGTLEAMAQAVFKEWFMDGAKEEWEEKTLRELFTISKASVNPGASPLEAFDHYSIPAFDEGRVPKQELGDTIKSNKFVVPGGCILISKLNPRFPRVWLPVLDGELKAISSTEFIVCVPKSDVFREFVYGLFTSQAFASEFNNMATGSTGSHQRVRPESMMNMTTVLPDRSTITAYSNLVRPMLDRITANTTESRTLAALRDMLLPKLMRGEVRVKQPTSISRNA